MSGSWSGWYEQCGVRYTFSIQIDCNGNIRGSGCDNGGAYNIYGNFNQCSPAVAFTKQYCGHVVYYNGILACNTINGTWTIPNPCGQAQTGS